MKKEKTAVGLGEAVPPLHGGFAIKTTNKSTPKTRSGGPVGRADPGAPCAALRPFPMAEPTPAPVLPV